ncbi:zinc finger E-box-binding homeobox 1-like [Culicoides brevitarsis]|uniref:zinc finger E-box-binding homeobox 1-like n=1 Tax=Culicoides brevitarsis TaxID=469753 RepID=UPI00307C4EF9
MGEYRCVNFYELCRLCTASQGKKVHIFSEEGKQKSLQLKINKGLLINVDENDKLPKILCTTCVQQVETIYEYKNGCLQAQTLLEGCLTSSKLRNGGQVYIKSGTPQQQQATVATLGNLKSEAPPLAPSFTITATPKMTTMPTQVAAPTNVSSDFLSSIIQAVGIQANEEHNEPTVVQQPAMPQYTLTIDGQTLKASPIQYKVETTPTFNLQPSASTSADSTEMSGSISVDEFLKLKSTPKSTRKVQPVNFELSGMTTNVTKKAKIELDKKPKINLVLSTPTKQQQTIPMTIPASMTNQQPKTISLQQLLQSANKQPQQQQQQQQPQTSMVPLIIKSDGTIEANNQILSQLIANNELTPTKQPPQPQYTQPAQQPTTYVQLKIQQNPDGQPTVQLMPQQIPQTVQLSTQAFQNLNIQQQIQQQIQAQLAAQAQQLQQQQQSQVQITSQQLQTAFNQAAAQQQQQQQQQQQPTISIAPSQQAHIIPQQIQTTPQQQVSVDTQVSQSDITMEATSFEEPEDKPVTVKRNYGKKPKETPRPATQTSQKPQQQTTATPPTVTQTAQQSPPKQQDNTGNNSDTDAPPTIESMMAQQQMQLITAIKHEGNDPPVTLTTCDVCKKVFKRKEHLMQHLKSHVGLRPFKCEEPGCNKSFSRKEHLLRHVVSHTGKKMFSCDLCHKFFSRKDNLNKHRRTHPEVGGDNVKGKKEKVQEGAETNPIVTKIKARKAKQTKQDGLEEGEVVPQSQQQQQQQSQQLLPQPTYQPIKITQPSDTLTQMQSQPIQIQMTSTATPSNTVQTIGTSQPQILQLPCIVSTSQGQQVPNSQTQQIAYTTNQTTTQATKTTYIKAVTSADGNTLYTIPLMQQSNYITTNAQGELQLGGFKIENS